MVTARRPVSPSEDVLVPSSRDLCDLLDTVFSSFEDPKVRTSSDDEDFGMKYICEPSLFNQPTLSELVRDFEHSEESSEL